MSDIGKPTRKTSIGEFGGIPYVMYQGEFSGKTNCGEFHVPYEITVPEDPRRGNGVVVQEPPHFDGGAIVRKALFGDGVLYGRGFSSAAVGYSNLWMRILDPKPPDFRLMICGKYVKVFPPGSTDTEIVTDDGILEAFARALKKDPPAPIAAFRRIYAMGFSDSGIAVHRIYRPFGRELFDLSLPCIGTHFEPVDGNPILVFNVEGDYAIGLLKPSATGGVPVPEPPGFRNYRWYEVAGGAHIADNPFNRLAFPPPSPPSDPPSPGPPVRPPVEGTSPIDWGPFLAALFVAGDEWVTRGKLPPPSAVLKIEDGVLVRDELGNAVGGIRHPALEIGEATFIASVERGRPWGPPWSLFGGYCCPRPLASIASDAYLERFRAAAGELVNARFLLPDDAEDLFRKAALDPQKTFTESYRLGAF